MNSWIRPEDQGTLADFIDPVILTVQALHMSHYGDQFCFYFNLD